MKYLEVYKCFILTLILIALILIWLNTRPPVWVRVRYGSIDVENTVQVEGTVSIER